MFINLVFMQIYKKRNCLVIDIEDINNRTSLLPLHLQNKIRSYTVLQKQQNRIEGLALLEQALIENQLFLDNFNLKHLKYTKYGKPFLDNKIDFSISYSNESVFLGFILNGIIGIDVEKQMKTDYSVYKDFFTKREWDLITSNAFPESIFFRLWTRKEAVAKALGYGAFLEFNTFEVIEDLISVKSILLKLETQFIDENYWLSIATNKI